MYKGKKIAAVIPARKGSKGIPNKNIIDLNGMPLVAYSITEALKSSYIDKVIVSTDSDEVYNIAKSYHIDMKGLRPAEFSNDTAILYDVLRYEIINHNLIEEKFDIMVLLQPTSPLRRSHMIDEALIKFVDENQISAVSVSLVNEHPIYMRTINENGELNRVLNVDSTIRRQDLPSFYRVNGMIYINKISDIVDKYVSFNDNVSPIIIPQEYDVDIDTMNDLFEAEKRLRMLSERIIE